MIQKVRTCRRCREELAAFDLNAIVGKSCLVNIIHKSYNGKT